MELLRLHATILLFILISFSTVAQNNSYWQEPTREQADSLKKVLVTSKNDTINMYINRQLGLYYQEIKRPLALAYFEGQLRLARKAKQKVWETEALSRIGYVSCLMQNYAGGLKSLLLATSMAMEDGSEKGMWNPGLLSKINDPYNVRLTILANSKQHLGLLHYFTGDFSKALNYAKEVGRLNEELKDDALSSLLYLNMGESYIGLKKYDSAEWSFNQAIQFSNKSGYKKYKGLIYYDLGKIYERKLKYGEAKKYYKISIENNIEAESPDFEGMDYQALADLFARTGNYDSVFFFSKKALNIYLNINDTLGLAAAYSSLASAFDERQQIDSAHYHLKKSIELKNALNKEGRVNSFQLSGFNEQFKLQELEAEQLRTRTKFRTYSFTASITLLLLIGGIFYRNYWRQRKDKETIEKAYAKLKSAQSQLIQSEKMASLGELTAGIAHEIQNPLNFVNNFSEVNEELLSELKGELSKGKMDDAIALANDAIENQKKINHHSKRADAIVKGMLQHSRASSGTKEPTDLNALCDEYLRLAYHGLRAKDKSFNAKFETDLDPTLPKINVVPQDIGRVILNLINNAFYAVAEKQKQNSNGFEPTVSVSTKELNGKVEIKVADNGNGIPDHIKEKIFQPFFTTKPTGQGTGLGLSLSYDIVKAHGGELKTETKVGQGTIFTIQLPALI